MVEGEAIYRWAWGTITEQLHEPPFLYSPRGTASDLGSFMLKQMVQNSWKQSCKIPSCFASWLNWYWVESEAAASAAWRGQIPLMAMWKLFPFLFSNSIATNSSSRSNFNNSPISIPHPSFDFSYSSLQFFPSFHSSIPRSDNALFSLLLALFHWIVSFIFQIFKLLPTQLLLIIKGTPF